MDCQMMEVQRQLSKKAGVPYTSFDGDQADYRNYSEAQFGDTDPGAGGSDETE